MACHNENVTVASIARVRFPALNWLGSISPLTRKYQRNYCDRPLAPRPQPRWKSRRRGD